MGTTTKLGSVALLATIALGCAAPSPGQANDTVSAVFQTTPEGTPLGTPITAPASQWTWVDVPGSFCDDGTQTGIGIWPSTTSSNIIFYFAGGGACWNYQMCAVDNTTTHGPYAAAQFNGTKGGFGGTVLDSALASNPFKDWTKVFVPYCTGDIHAGDSITTYARPNAVSKVMHHRGRSNVVKYLSRVAATYPSPGKVAVSGSSAGGGLIFNYPRFRAYWPNASALLIDDSLPLFNSTGLPTDKVQAWYASWNMDPVMTPICGSNCWSDPSQIFAGLAAQYPNDRMALLTSTGDSVIASYFGISAAQFGSSLTTLSNTVLEPTGHFERFVVPGTAHVWLLNLNNATAGVTLGTWLTRMVSGDPTWNTVGQ